MKKILFILVFFSGMLNEVRAQRAILGEWLTADGQAKVLIYKKEGGGNEYFGKVVWRKTKFGPARDRSLLAGNQPIALLDSALIEKDILEGFDYTGHNTWEYGQLHDRKRGKSYSCVLYLKNPRELQIKVYRSILPFHRTLTWTRSDINPQYYQP